MLLLLLFDRFWLIVGHVAVLVARDNLVDLLIGFLGVFRADIAQRVDV